MKGMTVRSSGHYHLGVVMAKKNKKKSRDRVIKAGFDILAVQLAPLRQLVPASLAAPDRAHADGFAEGYDRGYKAGLEAGARGAAE